MKLKNIWLPLVLLTIIGGGAKICDTVFNVHGSGFFLNTAVCNAISIGSVVLMVVLGWIFSVMDRKKQFDAKPIKGMGSGIFGFIASVMMIGGSVVTLLSKSSVLSDGFALISCLLTIVGGCVLLFEACISFTGQNGMKKIPVVALLVPISICARFVNLFIDYTEKSVLATEIFDMIAVALMLLFFLYQSMFFAGVNNNLAVRKSVVYGSAFFVCGLFMAVDMLLKMTYPAVESNVDTQIVSSTLNNIMLYAGDIAVCIYALCFMKDVLKSAENSLVDVDEELEPVRLAEDKPSKKKSAILLDEDEDEPETESKHEKKAEKTKKAEKSEKPEKTEKAVKEDKPKQKKAELKSEPKTEEVAEPIEEVQLPKERSVVEEVNVEIQQDTESADEPEPIVDNFGSIEVKPVAVFEDDEYEQPEQYEELPEELKAAFEEEPTPAAVTEPEPVVEEIAEPTVEEKAGEPVAEPIAEEIAEPVVEKAVEIPIAPSAEPAQSNDDYAEIMKMLDEMAELDKK